MDKLELPEDLVEFLNQGKELEYAIDGPYDATPGRLKLMTLGQHKLDEVWVDSENHPYAHTDPHFGEKGYYSVPAVGLISDCQYFDPCTFILLWLPEWNLYGTWDSDHWDLYIFPHATWTDIAANPLPYINAQWEAGRVECEQFVPWLTLPHKYEFKRGWPF